MNRRIYRTLVDDVIPAAWLLLLALLPVTALIALWFTSAVATKIALSNLILFGVVYAIDRIVDGG